MNQYEIILIALGLSLDAFAVSVTSGATIGLMHLRHAMLIAGFFGVFQAIMPVIGWLAGACARDYIREYDHWVAFTLLALVGGKMIYESFKKDDGDETKGDPTKLDILFVLAIATSIDALAVGITLSCLNVSILMPVIEIGAITFAMSFAGAYIGKVFGHLFERRIEAAGGLVLLAIGCKILYDHIYCCH